MLFEGSGNNLMFGRRRGRLSQNLPSSSSRKADSWISDLISGFTIEDTSYALSSIIRACRRAFLTLYVLSQDMAQSTVLRKTDSVGPTTVNL